MPSNKSQKVTVAALDPAKSAARPQRAAKRSEASGATSDLETAAKAALVDGSSTSEKSAAERLEDAVDKETANRKEAKRQKMTDAEQFEAFQKAAEEHGCDPDEDRFKGVLRKLATPKAS